MTCVQALTSNFQAWVVIKGAVGMQENFINGSYRPTEDIKNGHPAYQKAGDTRWWLWYGSNKKWCISLAATKDANETNCIMYSADTNLADPTHGKKWVVAMDGAKWEEQGLVAVTHDLSEVTLEVEASLSSALASGDPQSIAAACDLATAFGRESAVSRYTEAQQRLIQTASKVFIRGATGPQDSLINGIFKPTEELKNGHPVYAKANDSTVRLWYARNKHWWVSHTARKEANEIGGSAHCVELNIFDPTSARRWMVDTAKFGDQVTWEEQGSVVVTHDPSQVREPPTHPLTHTHAHIHMLRSPSSSTSLPSLILSLLLNI